jgi:hypothetical protein
LSGIENLQSLAEDVRTLLLGAADKEICISCIYCGQQFTAPIGRLGDDAFPCPLCQTPDPLQGSPLKEAFVKVAKRVKKL